MPRKPVLSGWREVLLEAEKGTEKAAAAADGLWKGQNGQSGEKGRKKADKGKNAQQLQGPNVL